MNEYEIKHNKYLRENGAECLVLLKKDGRFPLSSAGDIALYGNGARRTVKGGTGSGEVNSRFFVNVEDGLKNSGFNILTTDWIDGYDKIRNAAEQKFIKSIKTTAKKLHIPAIVYSMGKIMTEPEYDFPIDKKCDTAIYVLSRISGEGADRQPIKGDILLTDSEKRDILKCNSMYENFMLVINAGGVMDLSEITEVKNILVMSQLGVETGDILADAILGKSNPSGKLTTTWSSWNDYPDMIDFGDKNDTRYKEGIYVGYRYFDSVGKKALFPFGFGLSYTEFKISNSKVSLNGNKVTVSADVNNIGKKSGKEVVQVYVSVPSGKLDQPYQVLAAFTKTKELEAGASETVIAEFDITDLASYSEDTCKYILEPGDYIVRVGNSSTETTVAAVIEVAETIVTAELRDYITEAPDFKDYVAPARAAEDLTGVDRIKFTGDEVKVLKPDFDRDLPSDIDPLIKDLPDEDLIKMCIGAFNPDGGIADMVGNSGLSVAGAAGQTYLGKVKEGIPSMVLADGPAGVRISKEFALDKDGFAHTLGPSLPESMLMFMPKALGILLKFKSYKVKKTDVIKSQYATALPIGTAIAQSFNIDFAEKCGDIVGFEMEMFGVHLWLAPALNIHRSIRCGRNFEYYSEDPVISGEFAAAITRGVQAHKGCGVTIKHYAANNQEYNRTQSNSMVSIRAMREIYLKGFGIAVRKSAPKAVMTSYNLFNGIHTGEHRGLINDILRVEFGHRGIVMTDWVVDVFNNDPELKYPISKAAKVLMSGNDLFMPGGNNDYLEVVEALKKGEVTRESLQIAATRILNLARELVN